MEVQIAPEQESQLAELAAQTGRGTDELVREAVARLLAHNQWFCQQVQTGLDQISRGEFVDNDEVGERLERLFRS